LTEQRPVLQIRFFCRTTSAASSGTIRCQGLQVDGTTGRDGDVEGFRLRSSHWQGLRGNSGKSLTRKKMGTVQPDHIGASLTNNDRSSLIQSDPQQAGVAMNDGQQIRFALPLRKVLVNC
jgi:hypothetical protein